MNLDVVPEYTFIDSSCFIDFGDYHDKESDGPCTTISLITLVIIGQKTRDRFFSNQLEVGVCGCIREDEEGHSKGGFDLREGLLHSGVSGSLNPRSIHANNTLI